MIPPVVLLVASWLPYAFPHTSSEGPTPRVDGDAKRHATYGGAPTSATRVTYEGRFTLEAHLSKPHDTMVYGTRLTYLCGADDRARLDWETWPIGHEDRRDLDTLVVAANHVWHRPDAKEPFVVETATRAAQLRVRVEAGLPWHLVSRLGAAPERCSAVERDALTWSESADEGSYARRISWSPSTGRLETIAHEFAHPRLGDTRDELTYSAWEERDGVTVPSAFTLREFEGQNPLKTSPTVFDVHLAKVEIDVDVGHELDAPAEPKAPTTPKPANDSKAANAVGEITTSEVEPGVTFFASKLLDGSTCIVEFDDHLVAVGAPLSSELGERIVDAVRARYPSKPIRYVLFGHYHPHYTGGLRAFLAAGAKVVAAEQGARFAAEIAARPFTIAPDAWARAARQPEIESFRGTRVFEDAHRRLEVIDIGKKSNHTDEYLVFYLPGTRTLIQDDIGWSAAQDGKLYFGPRSKGLYEAITDRKLDVATLWQGWPVANPKPSLPFPEFERGVKTVR